MFMILWRCTLSGKDNVFLTWTGSILLFVNVQKISFSSKSHHKRSRPNLGVGYGLKNPAECLFHGNEKAIQWGKRTLYCIDGNVKKKKV